MLDQEFLETAETFLDRAVEMRLDGFVDFARMASRFFPPYFESLGFGRSEAEEMTILTISSIESDLSSYSKQSRQTLGQWLSGHLTRAVRNSVDQLRAESRELTAAIERQAEIFSVAEMPGMQVWAKYRAARSISGDFCDGIASAGGTYVVAVGDASGKGGAAAFYAMMALGLLRAKAAEVSDPVLLMRFVNDGLLGKKLDPRNYLSLTLASWNPVDRALTLCNAAGCHPLRMPHDGLIMMKLDGHWLGTHASIAPDVATYTPERGEILAIYSDGVLDQFDASDEPFGEERLALTIATEFESVLEFVADSIFDEIDRFRGDVPLTDDQTLVLMRFTRLTEETLQDSAASRGSETEARAERPSPPRS